MSYHILHQFDEQWFADSGQEDDQSQPHGFFRLSNKHGYERPNARTKALQRPWLKFGLSLIIAACALYFAMDARRQTIELQHRLNEVETRLKK